MQRFSSVHHLKHQHANIEKLRRDVCCEVVKHRKHLVRELAVAARVEHAHSRARRAHAHHLRPVQSQRIHQHDVPAISCLHDKYRICRFIYEYNLLDIIYSLYISSTWKS